MDPSVRALCRTHSVRAVQNLERAARGAERAELLRARTIALIGTAKERVRLGRRIAGSSGGDHLRERIQVALAAGALPRVDGRAWAGKSAGINTCACCGDLIAREAPEFEPREHPGLHAHAHCFTAWLAASNGHRDDSRRAGAAG